MSVLKLQKKMMNKLLEGVQIVKDGESVINAKSLYNLNSPNVSAITSNTKKKHENIYKTNNEQYNFVPTEHDLEIGRVDEDVVNFDDVEVVEKIEEKLEIKTSGDGRSKHQEINQNNAQKSERFYNDYKEKNKLGNKSKLDGDSEDNQINFKGVNISPIKNVSESNIKITPNLTPIVEQRTQTILKSKKIDNTINSYSISKSNINPVPNKQFPSIQLKHSNKNEIANNELDNKTHNLNKVPSQQNFKIEDQSIIFTNNNKINSDDIPRGNDKSPNQDQELKNSLSKKSSNKVFENKSENLKESPKTKTEQETQKKKIIIKKKINSKNDTNSNQFDFNPIDSQKDKLKSQNYQSENKHDINVKGNEFNRQFSTENIKESTIKKIVHNSSIEKPKLNKNIINVKKNYDFHSYNSENKEEAITNSKTEKYKTPSNQMRKGKPQIKTEDQNYYSSLDIEDEKNNPRNIMKRLNEGIQDVGGKLIIDSRKLKNENIENIRDSKSQFLQKSNFNSEPIINESKSKIRLNKNKVSENIEEDSQKNINETNSQETIRQNKNMKINSKSIASLNNNEDSDYQQENIVTIKKLSTKRTTRTPGKQNKSKSLKKSMDSESKEKSKILNKYKRISPILFEEEYHSLNSNKSKSKIQTKITTSKSNRTTHIKQPKDYSIYDIQKLSYNINKEYSNLKAPSDRDFMERMDFYSLKKQIKDEKIQELVEVNKVKIEEKDKRERFNHLIEDANRRLEAKQKIELLKEGGLSKEIEGNEGNIQSLLSDSPGVFNGSSEGFSNIKRAVSDEEWNQIYKQRFEEKMRKKNEKLRREKSKKDSQQKEEEDKIVQQIKDSSKKVPEQVINNSVKRLYEENERRQLKKETAGSKSNSKSKSKINSHNSEVNSPKNSSEGQIIQNMKSSKSRSNGNIHYDFAFNSTEDERVNERGKMKINEKNNSEMISSNKPSYNILVNEFNTSKTPKEIKEKPQQKLLKESLSPIRLHDLNKNYFTKKKQKGHNRVQSGFVPEYMAEKIVNNILTQENKKAG